LVVCRFRAPFTDVVIEKQRSGKVRCWNYWIHEQQIALLKLQQSRIYPKTETSYYLLECDRSG
jgi:hypothetical protein